MKEYNYNDESLLNVKELMDFKRDNPSNGYLKIRASSANEAVPVSELKIRVYKDIGDYRIVFFEGMTDYSGMINNIVLPSPIGISDDLIAPKFTEYKLEATNNLGIKLIYDISICCSITVIQYINITPNYNEGINYGN